jgi:sugar-specific transcriptional regulator TrmB
MEDLRNNLETLGFSPNESKVFMVLMKGKTQTAAEIAEDAGIPRPSVYEILKSFTEKGFCNEIETPSKLWYEIIDPDIVEDKIEKELNNTYKNKIDHLKGSFGRFKSLYKSENVESSQLSIELLRGFNMHRSRKFIELIESSQKEILLMNKLEGKISAEVDEVVDNFIKNGGVAKSIYETSGDFKIKIDDRWEKVTKKSFIDLCKSIEASGVQIRLVDKIDQNYAVFDMKTVFLNIIENGGEKKDKNDLIIRNKSYASVMRDTFDMYWAKGKTVAEYESQN